MTDQEIIERYRAIEAKMPQKKDSTAYDQSLRYAIICENEVIGSCTLAFSKLLLDRDEIVRVLRDQGAYRNDGTEGAKESCADAIFEAQKEKLKCQPNS